MCFSLLLKSQSLKYENKAKSLKFLTIYFVFYFVQNMKEIIGLFENINLFKVVPLSFISHHLEDPEPLLLQLWQLVVSYYFEFIIDDILLTIWQGPGKHEERLVSDREQEQ